MGKAGDRIKLILLEANQQKPQKQMNVKTLPIQGDWNTLRRWGIVQGESINDLFCEYTLPDGWKKVTTKDTSWLTNLIDSRGLIRAQIINNNMKPLIVTYNIERFVISNSHLYKTGDPPLHHEQYQVVDRGLSRYVFIDTPVYSGEVNDKLVAIKDSKIYIFEGETLQLEIKTQEEKIIKLLDMNEFFYKWRSHDSVNLFLSARKKLAMSECQQFLAPLPRNDCIWESLFDYPGLRC